MSPDDPGPDPRSVEQRAMDARLLRASIGRTGPCVVELADPRWRRTADEGRVVPLLAVAALADGVDISSAEFTDLDGAELELATAAVLMEQAFLTVADAFDAASVPFAVLKGLATAHLDHADPSWRQFGDIDLLVRPSEMHTVRRLLGAAGWRQSYALPDRHARFTHAVTYAGDGVLELDVHQRIGHRALGWLVPTEALLRDRVPFEVAGRTVWALGDLDRTIHACLHSVSSRGEYRRLSSVADVLLLSYLHEDRAADMVERAEAWRVRSLVETGVRDAWSAAQLPLPEGWAAAFRAPAAQRSWLVDRAYLGRRRRPITEELAHLRHLRGTRDRVSYVWGLLAPGAEYRAAKGRRGVRAQLRYLWQRLRSN